MTDTNSLLQPLPGFSSGVPIRPRLACLDNYGPGLPLLLLAVLPSQTAAFINIDRNEGNHPLEATILQKKRLNHHWAWRIIIKPEIYLSPYYAIEKKLCVIPDIDDKIHIIKDRKKSTIHDLDSLVTSPLNIWNEIVVAGFADGSVRGISIENNRLGQVRFKLKDRINARPIIEELNGRPWIFFGTAAGKFYSYDLHTIEQHHSSKQNGVQEKAELYYAGNCTLSAGTVFKPATQPKKRWLAFGCDNGRLHCIDAETGKTPSGPGIITLPIDVGRFLNKENIKIRSAVKFIKHGSVEQPSYEQPSYLVFYVDEAGGNTLEGKRFGRLCIVDLFKFADQVRFYPPASKNAVGPLIGSPQITDKGRICLTTKNDFTVLELAQKSPFEIKLLKQCRIEDGVSSTPLIIDSTAYFGSESGRLYATSTEHGRSQ